MIVSAMGIGRCTSAFVKTMLTGGSRQLFPLLGIRLVFKGASTKSPIDCAFSSICGNDVTPKRRRIYFVLAPGDLIETPNRAAPLRIVKIGTINFALAQCGTDVDARAAVGRFR